MAHALTLNSGTAALHTALIAAGVEPGNEVIVDPLVKFGAVAALQAQAIPIFADVNEETFLICAEDVRRKVTPRTRAVIATSLFGLMPEATPLRAAAPNAALICDHAHGLEICRDPTRSCYFDCVTFSFQMTKHINLGEGGMLVTNCDDIYLKALAVREHGWRPGTSAHETGYGWMYRMPEIVAALGLCMMDHEANIRTFHTAIGQKMNGVIEESPHLFPQLHSSEHSDFWMWSARIPDPELKAGLAADFDRLGCDIEPSWCHNGVAYSRGFLQSKRPAYLAPHADKYQPGTCPTAEALAFQLVVMRIQSRRDPSYYQDQANRLRSAIQTRTMPQNIKTPHAPKLTSKNM